VTSRSAGIASERPFYALHADAYDALITDPVEPWVDAVQEQLIAVGLRRASILDAGCGTGRQAQGLIARGHRVTLLDASPALLDLAKRRCPGAPAVVADLCGPDLGAPDLDVMFDAIVSRGVLNDLVGDDERDAACAAFADLAADRGLLILDVRESRASRPRADGRWRRSHARLDTGQTLEFRSRPTWAADRIVVDERYVLTAADGASSERRYRFEMRPWSPAELAARLGSVGFEDVTIAAGVGRRTPDRLLVTARRGLR
jgi:SAM-dependent methyltransferase